MSASFSERLQAALDGVEAIALRAKQQDRQPSTAIQQLITSLHVAGYGFVQSKEDKDNDQRGDDKHTPDGENGDAGPDNENGDADPDDGTSLFVPEKEKTDEGSEYQGSEADEGELELDPDLMPYEWQGKLIPVIAEWLNGLAPYITKLHSKQGPNFPTPCPYLTISPKPHQYRALGMIERCRDGPMKGLLIADPPGLGKTLISMMAVVKAIATAQLYSVVVVPASCIEQWYGEFQRFFQPGSVKVLVVRDGSVPITTMVNYDVIIISYHFVMSQYRKLRNFREAVSDFSNGTSGVKPSRPQVGLFADILQDLPKSPYLVLDEVNAIKNEGSLTYEAIRILRLQCDTCIMLSGTPIDNTWPDVFAFLQMLDGVPITNKTKMKKMLGTPADGGGLCPPRYRKYVWFTQILNSFIVRRPESTISLPPLHAEEIFFNLNEVEADISQEKFKTYQIASRIEAGPGEDPGGRFKSLTHALQHAWHPDLVELMEFLRYSVKKKQGITTEREDQLFDAEDIEHWTSWRENLRANENWKSTRIMALIKAFNRQRDLDPSSLVIIFDESVYFLDIVQIAFSAMYDPVECLRYDGRQLPENRGSILTEFQQGGKVLLMSRAAGGVGLNIAFANVVIQTGPWWKREWEEQAVKRVWRSGQQRPVTYITLRAKNCAAEKYKAQIRDRKHKFNRKVLNTITREDGDKVKVWNDLI